MTIIEANQKQMLEAISPAVRGISGGYEPKRDYDIIQSFYDIAQNNPVILGVENVEIHGEFPLRIEYYFSKKGKLITLKESGKGFDFEEVQRKFIEKEKYFTRMGNGFEVYNIPYFFVSFEDEGRQINFLRLSSKSFFD